MIRDNDDDVFFGMRRGESISMERHGEMGLLYRSIVQLNADELMLYARVNVEWGERDLVTRDNVVKLVERVAFDTISDEELRGSMIKNVMAYIDELHTLSHRQGSA
jgi:hypothetical protein